MGKCPQELKKERLRLSKQDIVFSPASLEQQNFLTAKDVDFAFYGGE